MRAKTENYFLYHQCVPNLYKGLSTQLKTSDPIQSTEKQRLLQRNNYLANLIGC